MTLLPGQYQIGNFVFGTHTNFKVDTVDIGNYDVNVQDFQIPTSDETRFGSDTLKPAPIQLTINALVNRTLDNVAQLTNDHRVIDYSGSTLGQLQDEWRAEEIRSQWGVLKPLLYCGEDGITRRFYGRPGKFAYSKRPIKGLFYQIQAEYRRSDTLCYSDIEYYIDFAANAPQTVTRSRGDAPNWLRMLIYGPAAHPVINFGTAQLELDYSIAPGELVEISSYPWARRIISSNGQSLSAYLIADSPYLSQIRLRHDLPIEIAWTATGLGGGSKMTLAWHDGYQVME